MANARRSRRGLYDPSKHYDLLLRHIEADNPDMAIASVLAHVAQLPSPKICKIQKFPFDDIRPIISTSHFELAEDDYRKEDYQCPACKQTTPKKDVITHTRFDSGLKDFEEFHYVLGESPEPRSLRIMWTCPNPDCGKTMDITHEAHYKSVTVKKETDLFHDHPYMPKPPDVEPGPHVDYVRNRSLMTEWINIAVEKIARGKTMLNMAYENKYGFDFDDDVDGGVDAGSELGGVV